MDFNAFVCASLLKFVIVKDVFDNFWFLLLLKIRDSTPTNEWSNGGNDPNPRWGIPQFTPGNYLLFFRLDFIR